MRNMWVRTANESVQGVKAVNEIRFNQKIQRAINCRRRSLLPVLAQTVENLIRAYRLVAVPDQLKDSFSLSSESQAAFSADSFRILDRLLDTIFVVVLIS